ncbi:class I SAM-dependent methyltransferase [Polaromonas sp.]|uniref:class I SAM-dependent methyltransferase n=1 Tax=Polaromonas sp. TaxID=1869339 RepID=UPI003BABA1D4
MHEVDKKVMVERYAQRVKQGGHGPAALGEPKSRQAFYFDFLLQAEGLLSSDSIIDIGCGYGDLYSYLKACGWTGRYTGVDINPELIAEGKRRYPEADLRVVDLQLDSFNESFDWCICCATLTSNTKGTPFEEHLKQMLDLMWAMSRKGLSFNLLSPLADYTNPIHARPAFDVVLPLVSGLTKRFSLRHDYMPFEYAVYAYKDAEINRELLIFSNQNEHFVDVTNRWSASRE